MHRLSTFAQKISSLTQYAYPSSCSMIWLIIVDPSGATDSVHGPDPAVLVDCRGQKKAAISCTCKQQERDLRCEIGAMYGHELSALFLFVGRKKFMFGE